MVGLFSPAIVTDQRRHFPGKLHDQVMRPNRVACHGDLIMSDVRLRAGWRRTKFCDRLGIQERSLHMAKTQSCALRQPPVSRPNSIMPTSATPGSGGEKTADDRGDRFQLLGSGVRLHAEVLERGGAKQVERIRRGEDDGARKRFVQLWDG